MAGKHRRVAEVPFDEVRDAATLLGYPVDSVVLEHPDTLGDVEFVMPPPAHAAPVAPPAHAAPVAPSAPAAHAARPAIGVEPSPVLPVPAGSRRSRLENRRNQARRNRLVGLGAVAAMLVAAVGWAVLHGGGDPAPAAAGVSSARSQTTLLLQVVDGQRMAVVTTLLAHDGTGAGNGFAALIPSTLEVNVAGIGNASLAQTSSYTGSNAPALAVSDALGVIVDGTWTLTSEGLARLVDAAGGVQLTVDRDVLRAGVGGAGATVLLPAGPQKLDGATAALYATYLADGEPEAKRLARFSDVFREVLAALPTGADQVAATLGRLGDGSTSSMKVDRIASLLAGLRGDVTSDSLIVQNLPTRSLDGGGSGSTQVIDPSAEAVVSSGFAGSRPAKRAAGEIRVLVQNGVGTPGLGEIARTALVKEALSFINGGNATSFGYATSKILISDVGSPARAQGSAVAKALGLPESDIEVAATGQSLADVIVVLGADFKP